MSMDNINFREGYGKQAKTRLFPRMAWIVSIAEDYVESAKIMTFSGLKFSENVLREY